MSEAGGGGYVVYKLVAQSSPWGTVYNQVLLQATGEQCKNHLGFFQILTTSRLFNKVCMLSQSQKASTPLCNTIDSPYFEVNFRRHRIYLAPCKVST
jgi:hypothetical protein